MLHVVLNECQKMHSLICKNKIYALYHKNFHTFISFIIFFLKRQVLHIINLKWFTEVLFVDGLCSQNVESCNLFHFKVGVNLIYELENIFADSSFQRKCVGEKAFFRDTSLEFQVFTKLREKHVQKDRSFFTLVCLFVF